MPNAAVVHKQTDGTPRGRFATPVEGSPVTPQCSIAMPGTPAAIASDTALAGAFADYVRRHPDERRVVDLFLALLGDASDPFVRERLQGHFTASALVLGRDGTRTLLTHHRKLGLWLQPGGHADGDRDLMRVALRETGEETGLRDVHAVPAILDLDRHRIPEHKGVPAHWHYDVRYLVQACGDESFVVSAESHALAWRPLVEVATGPAYDASLRRMAAKVLARGSGVAARQAP